MITVLGFLMRTPQSDILPTLAQGALWALCVVTIALAFQAEFRRDRSRVPGTSDKSGPSRDRM